MVVNLLTNTLSEVLCAHALSSLVAHRTVPRSRNGDTCRECRDEVRISHCVLCQYYFTRYAYTVPYLQEASPQDTASECQDAGHFQCCQPDISQSNPTITTSTPINIHNDRPPSQHR